MVELVRHATRFTHITAVLGERGPHFRSCTIAIVCQALNDDGHTTWTKAFILNVLVNVAIAGGRAADRAFDIILRHGLAARFLDRQAQARIGIHILTAQFGGHRNFTGQLGKQFGPLGVLCALAIHDVFEFGMTCHGSFFPLSNVLN